MALIGWFTTHGNIRGDCGHRHKSIESAQKCLNRDQAGCKMQGGYSDRKIMFVNALSGDMRRVEMEEEEEF